MRMPLIPPPHVEGYPSYLAMQMLDGPETFNAALGDEPVQLPPLQFLKSLDDLDEEEDDDDDIEDLDEEDEEDEEDEDDLDEDYDDEDEDEDDDDEDEEDDDEDGGVKPLKMASSASGSSSAHKTHCWPRNGQMNRWNRSGSDSGRLVLGHSPLRFGLLLTSR